MHDFSVFRTVHGPYDVPLDDPKQRFGQQRRKNRPRPCCISPFLYGSTLDYKGNSKPISKRDDVEAQDAAAAGAAAPHALVVRAPERDHVHRRGVLYIPLTVPSPDLSLIATCRRDLVSSSVRRLGEAEPWFELLRGGQTFLGQDTGHQQVWSHRDPGLTQKSHALCLTIAASAPMSSHIPL